MLNAEILRTAQSLFNDFGVEAVSMHQIAKTVGIGQGTLYRRYSNKGDLCRSLMKDKFDRFMEEIETYLERSKERPVEERLGKIITDLIVFTNRDMEWVRTMLSCARLEDTRDQLFEAPPFKFIRGTIRKLLAEAQDEGKLIPLDPEFTSCVLAASSLTPEMMFYLHESGYSSEEIAERLSQTFLAPLFIR
ncbi:TetR/AcrR family transcriptional regulator [Cohnella algarum]|nr:TetR/AcrR family transcriptional regulator [Cohnella algarum]